MELKYAAHIESTNGTKKLRYRQSANEPNTERKSNNTKLNEEEIENEKK